MSLARRGKFRFNFCSHRPIRAYTGFIAELRELEAGFRAVCYGMFWTCIRQCFNALCTSFTDHTNHSNLHFTVCCWQFVTAVVLLHGLSETTTALVGVWALTCLKLLPHLSFFRFIKSITHEEGGCINTRP
jgi:hypothetical protein